MNTIPKTSDESQERRTLEKSEKHAAEKQPGSFKEDENDEKVVEIPHAGPDRKPIRGLDPK